MRWQNRVRRGNKKRKMFLPLAVLSLAILFIGLYWVKFPRNVGVVEASVSTRPEVVETMDNSPVVAVPLNIPEITIPSVEPIESVHPEEAVSSPFDDYLSSLDGYLRILEQGSSELIENTWGVNRFVVRGNYYLTDEEVIDWLAPIEPNASSLLTGSIKNRLREHPWIENVQIVSSIYPLQIDLRISEARPWLVVEFEEGGSWLISRKGAFLQSLETISDSDLIVQVAELARLKLKQMKEQQGANSTELDGRLVSGVKMIRLIELAGGAPFEVDHYELSQDESLILFPRDHSQIPKVIAKPETFREAQMLRERVGGVIRDASGRKEIVASIDLRFRGQAVVKLRK